LSFHLDHVQLPVAIGGLHEARRFYRELIGLPEIRDGAPGQLQFQLGSQRLRLAEGHYLGVAPNAHLALQVDDLAPLRERLRGARVAVTSATSAESDQLEVEDPFGNHIAFIAPRRAYRN